MDLTSSVRSREGPQNPTTRSGRCLVLSQASNRPRTRLELTRPHIAVGTRELRQHRIGGRHAKRSGRWRLPSSRERGVPFGQFKPAPASLSASPIHSPFQSLPPHSGGSLRGPAAQWLRQVRATARGHQVSGEVGDGTPWQQRATSLRQRTCPPPSLIGCASGTTPFRALINNK